MALVMPWTGLVSRLQALLHEGRLKVQRELDEAETLVRELQDFRIEFKASLKLSFAALGAMAAGSVTRLFLSSSAAGYG